MRPDDLRRALAGHELVRLLHHLLHPRVAAIELIERDVIRQLNRDRAAPEPPHAARDVEHADRLWRRARGWRATRTARAAATPLTRRHLRDQGLDVRLGGRQRARSDLR